MKKFTILLAVAASTFALASCGDGGGDDPSVKELVANVSGGSAEEREAIQTCVKKSIAQVSNKTPILIGNSYDLLADNGDFLEVATTYNTKVTSGKKYNVAIEWDFGTSDLVAEVTDPDSVHKMVEFNYPGQGGQDTTYSFSIKKMTCGGASTTDPQVKYTCNVKKSTFLHYDVHVDELNKVHKLDDGSYYYEIADETDANHAYFKSQPENVGKSEKGDKYYYVSCPGKVIYYTPDGNWGLLADGDHVMEIYAGSELNIGPTRYPAMKGDYVKVLGNMGQYNGNIQISYITEMKKATVADLKNGEPSMNYQTITDTMIASIKNELGGHKQCVPGANLSNALAQMEATYVPGTLKGSDGKATTKDKLQNARFTFDVMVGTEKVTIAYDYHVDRDGTHGVFEAVKAMVDAEGTFNIKGTLRFQGDDEHPFAPPTEKFPGAWQLVPFLPEHVSAK